MNMNEFVLTRGFRLMGCGLIAVMAAIYPPLANAQLRVVTYNTFNNPDTGTDANYQTILSSIAGESINGIAKRIDILAVQEQSASPNTTGNLAAMLNGLHTGSWQATAVSPGAANGQFSQSVELTVLDPAQPAILGSAAVDLGTLAPGGSVVLDLFDKITNVVATAGFTAALDLDLIVETADPDDRFNLEALFAQLAAGESGDLRITFDATQTGAFHAAYTLWFSDEDLPGASAFAGQGLTLDVTAIVAGPSAPEPASLLPLACGAGMIRARRRAAV